MGKIYMCDFCGKIVGEVACTDECGGSYCSAKCAQHSIINATADKPDEIFDLIANLARRVTQLESQLADERQAQELEGVKHDGEQKFFGKIPTYKMSDLIGKTLTFYGATDDGWMTVIGREENGISYVISHEKAGGVR